MIFVISMSALTNGARYQICCQLVSNHSFVRIAKKLGKVVDFCPKNKVATFGKFGPKCGSFMVTTPLVGFHRPYLQEFLI
jgi:hypothetical protein